MCKWKVGGGVGDVKYKLGAALVHSCQVSGSDVGSWYGYYTVLLLTLPYVHELSIRRLLFVYTRTT